MLVVLRDGRKLHGVLRSYDQFANLVLEDTYERIYHGNTFAQDWRGLFLIRGENVVLLGEIDLDTEDDIPLRQVDHHVLEPYCKSEAEDKRHRDEVKAQVLYDQKGFSREGGEGDGY
ncbi:hypothetical protein AX14_006862 [Amanita brunnescens Koide BX004]|nr:hypothetical protein AX14_006862 [Amanita brunnescens Koide BX004]